MIVLPKYKDLYAELKKPYQIGIGGEFKCVLRDLMGRVVHETDWSHNTIYDAGLDLIATDQLFTYSSIGDNNAATVEAGPNVLGNRMDTSDSLDDDAAISYGTNPLYEFSRTVRMRYNAGVAMAVREIGIHPFVQPDNLYCRNLVTPEFSKTSDQVLDIYYKHIIYPSLADVIQNNVLIDGVLYNTLMRGTSYAKTSYSGAFEKMGYWSGSSGSTWQRHWDGDIGADVEAGPAGTGTTAYGFGQGNLAYTPGNHYIDCDLPIRLQDGNLSTGSLLRCTTYPLSQNPIQIQWDSQASPGNGIPKDATKTMYIVFRQAWVRH